MNDFYQRMIAHIESRSEELEQIDPFSNPNGPFPSINGPAYTAILIAAAEFLTLEREKSMGVPCLKPEWLNVALSLAFREAGEVVDSAPQWAEREQ